MIKKFGILFTFLLVSVLTAKDKVNVLLITADDLGLQLGCYGDDKARTPALDGLANQSVQFNNAYVTHASCSPSRSSMLTGMFPHENGQIGLSHLGYRMYDHVQVLPNMLKENGYITGVVGKVHVEPFDTMKWDHYVGKKANARDAREMADVSGDFFKKSGDQPFFFMVNYSDPHRHFPRQVKGIPEVPFEDDEIKPFAFLGGVDDPKVREEMAGYYNCVARLDKGIEFLLEELEKSGKAENTLIIFLGDHGPPFTRSKTTCYESAVKVPFFVRMPDGKFAGQKRDELISSIDIVPTILESVGIRIPEQVTGKSLLPIILEPASDWREYLATEYTGHHGKNGYYPRRSIRNDQFKLIHNLLHDRTNPHLSVDRCAAWDASQLSKYDNTLVREVMNRYKNPPKYELYDLSKDPDELIDLSSHSNYKSILNTLIQELEKWQEETKDPLRTQAGLNALNETHKNWQDNRTPLH